MRISRTAPWLSLVGLLCACSGTELRYVQISPSDGEVRIPDAGAPSDADAVLPLPPLSIGFVRPANGPFSGGTQVTISGSGFNADTQVAIGDVIVSAEQTTLVSPVALELITPSHAPGKVDIRLRRFDQQATLNDGFTYDPVTLEPPDGPTVGGTLVTIRGIGTQFTAGMKVELGGAPMTAVDVISPTELTAKTPAGAQGPATLVFAAASGDISVTNAFRYYNATDPAKGGLSGGPIAGTLTVSVLDWDSRMPVPDARVYVQKAREFAFTALSDAQGVAVFSDAKLKGPLTVTAGKQTSTVKYQTSTLVDVDGRDVTIFLTALIDPQPGPLPPGQRLAVVSGHVLFGGTTGAGASDWGIVPPPKPGQRKRAYVYTSNPNIRFGPPAPQASATIDQGDANAIAWPYDLFARPGTFAVYVVAGLFDESTGNFSPYAMGISRGVVAGPGDRLKVDVLVNTPLTERIAIETPAIPQRVNRYRLRLAIDLGADGVLVRDDMQIEGDGRPSSFSIGRLPLLNQVGFQDSSYSVDFLLEDAANAIGLPTVRAVESRVFPKNGKIVIEGLLTPPQQVKPAPGSPLYGNTLAWSSGKPTPSIAVTLIERSDQTPVWMVISPGDVSEVKLPDPQTVGLPDWPAGGLTWTQYVARIPGYDYKNFNYDHVGTRYWDRWSIDQFLFEGQSP